MSRFMTNPAVINDQFDTICENAYISIAAAVDDEPMEVATEGFKDTVKEAFTKVCDTIMKWIRKIIDVFKNVKKWIVDHAKLIIAKFKGKQEAELNDTNKLAAAVNELKKEAKEAIAEMKEDAEEAKKEEKAADSGSATVEPEVLDDDAPGPNESKEAEVPELKSAEIAKQLEAPQAKQVLLLDGPQAHKTVIKNIDQTIYRLTDVNEIAAGLREASAKYNVPPARWVKTPNKNEGRPGHHAHKRKRGILRAQQIMKTASYLAKKDEENMRKLASLIGANKEVDTSTAEAK